VVYDDADDGSAYLVVICLCGPAELFALAMWLECVWMIGIIYALCHKGNIILALLKG